MEHPSKRIYYLLAVAQKIAHMFVEGFGFRRVEPMFQRILIAFWRAGSFGPAVHPAAGLARDSGGLTGRAVAGFRAATRSLHHGACVAFVGG